LSHSVGKVLAWICPDEFMRLIARLERRLGRFAVPNLTLLLIAGQVVTFLLSQNDPQLFDRIAYVPAKVLDGEVYRLLTFLFLPPGRMLLWAFFFWYLFYLMGTALEHYWGTFRYNLFLLIGYLATVLAAFIQPQGEVANWFLQGTVFLAFAWLNPRFTLHIFFILPVQIRWLALLTWIGFGLTLLFGTWEARLAVAASVCNFFVFFGNDVWHRIRTGRRHMAQQARRFAEKPPEYYHRCSVCGITDASHPEMDFRYCSQCDGDHAYCEEHLRNHEHIRS
jgi:hypothetical protein